MYSLSTERKFVADHGQADAALAIVSHHCLPDPAHPVGSIASVYYDTPGLAAYAEKADGDHLKKKVRVRWYAEDRPARRDRHPAFFECKHRVGRARFKLRATLETDYDQLDRAPLDGPFFPSLLERGAHVVDDALRLELRPVICIRYTRRRFVCPRTHTRIAVDTGIHADRLHPVLIPGATPVRLDVALCEFKHDRSENLPWFRDLTACGFRLESFSKYGLCLARAINGGI